MVFRFFLPLLSLSLSFTLASVFDKCCQNRVIITTNFGTRAITSTVAVATTINVVHITQSNSERSLEMVAK